MISDSQFPEPDRYIKIAQRITRQEWQDLCVFSSCDLELCPLPSLPVRAWFTTGPSPAVSHCVSWEDQIASVANILLLFRRVLRSEYFYCALRLSSGSVRFHFCSILISPRLHMCMSLDQTGCHVRNPTQIIFWARGNEAIEQLTFSVFSCVL